MYTLRCIAIKAYAVIIQGKHAFIVTQKFKKGGQMQGVYRLLGQMLFKISYLLDTTHPPSSPSHLPFLHLGARFLCLFTYS